MTFYRDELERMTVDLLRIGAATDRSAVAAQFAVRLVTKVPWVFPDPNPFPEFILFPRLARLERKVKR